MLFGEQAPLFGHAILRTFVEAYQVAARVLGQHPERELDDEKAFIKACMRQGEEMLLRRRIDSAASLSQPLFATAWRLCDYRGLLRGPPAELVVQRKAFAVEIADAVRAVDLLQNHYDQHQELTCDS